MTHSDTLARRRLLKAGLIVVGAEESQATGPLKSEPEGVSPRSQSENLATLANFGRLTLSVSLASDF